LPNSPDNIQQIKTVFESNNLNLTHYDYSDGTVHCTIDAGEWLAIDTTDLRMHTSTSLKELYAVAEKFPQIHEIEAELNAPSAAKKDEYGHDLPQTKALMVFLDIDADDLRKFPKDFDWNLYPIYVANRYRRGVNGSLRELWDEESNDERKEGGFTNELETSRFVD
jgi:hypothetical protein